MWFFLFHSFSVSIGYIRYGKQHLLYSITFFGSSCDSSVCQCLMANSCTPRTQESMACSCTEDHNFQNGVSVKPTRPQTRTRAPRDVAKHFIEGDGTGETMDSSNRRVDDAITDHATFDRERGRLRPMPRITSPPYDTPGKW